ncbi:MAG: S8 family serine peptidase [Bacteroidales bacterium]|nr:S8 family serine peptidase [Bacteroidales bacterium]MDD3870609.1 S8 family serine peptidase [Bacteroidales bacterium]
MNTLAHPITWIIVALAAFLPAIRENSAKCQTPPGNEQPALLNSNLSLTAREQLNYLDAELFRIMGLSGKKIRIAVIDAGFPGTNTHPGLKHLFDNKQIIATWDFVRNREDVYTGNPHGTAVLSCIAGIYQGTPLGLAPDAEFLLARTEMNGEPRREEINWGKAVEWAIANGAQIIQSSLGYTYHRYFLSDLDGKTSPSSRAASYAAKNNILIINAMGNEGANKWFYLGTPADADSILSVGAIDPKTGIVANFSSRGPTADRRSKPNISAPGKVAALSPKGIRIMFGTSFSAPLVTGFAACLWQMNPDATAMDILRQVEQAGHLYPYYDYAHGFGIPKASRVLNTPRAKPIVTVSVDKSENGVTISTKQSPVKSNSNREEQYLYYHIARPDGYLRHYGVYRILEPGTIQIDKYRYLPGDVIRATYRGTQIEWRATK